MVFTMFKVNEAVNHCLLVATVCFTSCCTLEIKTTDGSISSRNQMHIIQKGYNLSELTRQC